MAVLGVAIAGGDLYAVEVDGLPTPDAPFMGAVRRIKGPASLTVPHHWFDFLNAVDQLGRDLSPSTIALADTRKYNQLTWAAASSRALCHAALLQVCATQDIEFQLIPQQTCEAHFEVDDRKNFRQTVSRAVGVTDEPTYWPHGFLAVAAAVTSVGSHTDA